MRKYPGSSATQPATFADLPQAVVCDTQIYQELAAFFVVPERELADTTVAEYMRSLANYAKKKFERAPAYDEDKRAFFFSGLIPYGMSGTHDWFRKLLQNTQRAIFTNAMERGEVLGQEKVALSREMYERVCEQLAREGTKDATMRCLAIKADWHAAGRAAEPANVSFELMSYDPFTRAAIFEWGQSKTSICKRLVVFPGAGRHSCFYKTLGDAFALAPTATRSSMKARRPSSSPRWLV